MDATKEPSEACLFWALKNLIRPGDSVTILGILHRINTPMGYKSQANLSDFVGTNRAALESEMSQKLVVFEDKLRVLADLCDNRGVYLDITITAGTPLKSVLVKEATKMKVTHVLLDRHLRKDRKYYKEKLLCEVVALSENNQAEHVRGSSISYIFNNSGLPFSRLNSTSSTDRSSGSSTATSNSYESSSIPNSKEESRAPSQSDTVRRENVTSNQRADVISNNNRQSQDLGDLSAESDTQSAASSSSHSRENSFIDLFMLSSPDGVMPIWTSANENELIVSEREISRNQVDPNLEGRSLSTNLKSSLTNGSNKEEAKAEDSAPSTSYHFDDHRPSVFSQKEVISVQPRRHYPQLNELMRDHENQYGSDGCKKDADGRFVDSQVQVSVNKEEFRSIENLNSDAVVEIEKKEKSIIPLQGAEDVLVKHFSQAPPLCSVCKLTSAELGRTPRDYDWLELKDATQDFAPENLIAEGGFSFVYRGTLPEGRTVAIKKLKTTSLQSEVQFATEVEALSCAQHRNLVRLLGYSVGGSDDRALVYEYVCNGSLDRHLSGHNGNVLQWSSRYKIAIGAARGLRYLHEECRVGCIVHRDMRPNNILVTHDFVPMVGDFGLAKMNSSVNAAIETQVVGALGFLAPEYVECGQVTSKTDVYSFGVVLLELISGRKAIDLQRPKGEVSLVEWARQKLHYHRIHELVDQRISDSMDMLELDMMVKTASLCINRDPQARPGMSQVLRILEGDFYEFSNELAQENCSVDSSSTAPHQSQNHEESHQSLGQGVGRMQMLQGTSKRVSTVPKSWRSWVRPS